VVVVYVEEPGDLTQQALAFARTLGEPLHAFAAGEAVPIGGVETLYIAEDDVFSAHAPAAIQSVRWMPTASDSGPTMTKPTGMSAIEPSMS